MDEVPARSAHLPDAFVGFLPLRLERPQERELQGPRVFVDREAGARALPHDVGELAVHVELELFVRGVADPHRRRVAPARQPIEGQLGEPSFAGDAVHDL